MISQIPAESLRGQLHANLVVQRYMYIVMQSACTCLSELAIFVPESSHRLQMRRILKLVISRPQVASVRHKLCTWDVPNEPLCHCHGSPKSDTCCFSFFFPQCRKTRPNASTAPETHVSSAKHAEATEHFGLHKMCATCTGSIRFRAVFGVHQNMDTGGC